MAGIAWRGQRACQCVIDATYDFEVRRGKLRRVFQGSYSHAAASAGTHSKGGALDHEQRSAADHLEGRKIGLWLNNRDRNEGFDPHCHSLVFGCPHMAGGLKYQESELRAGRNGLANRKKDRFPRPAHIVTYAQYRRNQRAKFSGKGKVLHIAGKDYPEIGSVSVYWVNRARKLKYMSRHVFLVQAWLRRVGMYKGPCDGKWGPSTQAALDNFRRKRLGWPAKDSQGPLGISSLAELRRAAKSTRLIQEGK